MARRACRRRRSHYRDGRPRLDDGQQICVKWKLLGSVDVALRAIAQVSGESDAVEVRVPHGVVGGQICARVDFMDMAGQVHTGGRLILVGGIRTVAKYAHFHLITTSTVRAKRGVTALAVRGGYHCPARHDGTLVDGKVHDLVHADIASHLLLGGSRQQSDVAIALDPD